MSDNKKIDAQKKAAQAAVASKKEKKSLKQRLREYRSELKKISWPTLPEVVKNTLVTIAVVLIVGVFIWLLDWGLEVGRSALLGQANNTTSSTVSDVADTVTNTDLSDSNLSDTDLSDTDLSNTDAE